MKPFRPTQLILFLLGSLVLAAACGDDPKEKPRTNFFEPNEFGTYEFSGEPDIESEARLNFGDVAQGETFTKIFEVHNHGRADLVIQGWTVPERFELSAAAGGAAPTKVRRGESVALALTYTAIDEEGYQAELVIDSNDPDTPKWNIDLYANLRFPCLAVSPDEIDYGIVEPETASIRRIRLESCSPNAETRVSLRGIDGNPVFFLVGERLDELVLQPGDVKDVTIAFRPTAPGAFEGVARFETDDPFDPEQDVLLRGAGKEAECPVAIIEARRDARTAVANPSGTYNGLPLDRVTLDASRSYDPDGTELKYTWTVMSRPTDSGARLEFDDDLPLNELWLDLVGEYTVQLDIENEEGVPACQAARLRLVATADEDIHVQLVWNTPNDPDQSDTSGSDVDLHLLHPEGTWNLPPYDCFWQNLEPDWGEPRRIAAGGQRVGYDDDPSLDIDDVDGWGPENINLDNPEALTYDVGVHYFADHGYSDSFATVRLYIGGQLFAEFLDQRLTDQDFWHVAKIEWPGGLINRIDRTYPSFPDN